MRRALLASALVALVCAPSALAAPGDLDETFSEDGLIVGYPPFGGGDLVVDADGSIVVPGIVQDGLGFSVRRYAPTGAPDPSFGPNGLREHRLGFSVEPPQMEGQPGGGYLLAATDYDGGDVEMMRLRADGSLDPSLGGDGRAELNFGGTEDRLADFNIGPGGETVVAVSLNGEPGGPDLAVTRLLPDGSPDPAFGGVGGDPNGWVRIPLPPLAQGGAVGALAGGSALVASMGPAPDDTGSGDVVLRRLDASGALDPGFGGGDGFVAGADLGAYELPVSLAHADGRIDVGVRSCAFGLHTTCDPALQRFTESGEVAPGSPANGLRGQLPGWLVEADGEGRTLVAGAARPENPAFGFDFGVARVLEDGGLDPSFSQDGTAFADFELTSDEPQGVAVDPSGRVVVAGTIPPVSHGVARFEVVEGPADADADGMLDADDQCPARFSTRPSGCPTIPRTHELRLRGKRARTRLIGVLTSDAEGCRDRVPVVVKRKQRGRDRVVKRVKTSDALWKLRSADLRGRIYGLAKASRVPEVGRCARARSRVVRP